MFNIVDNGSGEPPVGSVYQVILVPVAVKLPTAPPLQKYCVVLPVGADGVTVPILTKTTKRSMLSHAPTVWVA